MIMTNWMKFKEQNASSFNLQKNLHGRWTWDKAQRFMIYEVTPEKGTENGEIMINQNIFYI